jgi:wobble nucleotide-excising tRNase
VVPVAKSMPNRPDSSQMTTVRPLTPSAALSTTRPLTDVLIVWAPSLVHTYGQSRSLFNQQIDNRWGPYSERVNGGKKNGEPCISPMITRSSFISRRCSSTCALSTWCRARLTNEKEEAKEQLEKQAGNVLEEYQASINRFLEKFGASFRMIGTRPDFSGGKASSIYKIEINHASVDLGDSKTKPGTVCFRTALSSGDRSTLALAFFLARLERDPRVSSKLVVFDDPLSSLDCFRSVCTQQEISRVVTGAAQVVVMSHDAFFLQSLHSEDGTAKTLHITRQSGAHQMREWDIEDHCASQAHRDYFLLKSFLDDGVPTGSDLTGIARRIRPYVEDYVRHKYPGDFRGEVNLGKCIEKIRALPIRTAACHTPTGT